MSRLLCKGLLLACCVCGKITVWLCNSTVAETICSRCDPAAAGWVFKHVLEKVDPQNPEKEKKTERKETPTPWNPPPHLFLKVCGAVRQQEEFSSSLLCSRRPLQGRGWHLNGLPQALDLLTSALGGVYYTCLPSSCVVWRGWERCPYLCFDLPGKVKQNGTKETEDFKNIPPRRATSTFPPRTRSVGPSAEDLIDCCWSWRYGFFKEESNNLETL